MGWRARFPKMPHAEKSAWERLLELPEHVVGEILDGVLHVSPRPASPHAFASTRLLTELSRFDREGPGGFWILFEPELHLGADVIVPDLAGWRRERMPVVPDLPAFELAPDWVCEVVSPGTAALDRVGKLPRYARHGVAWAWIVDPLARTIEVYEREKRRLALAGGLEGPGRERLAPFDEIELDAGRLWLPRVSDG